MRLWLPLLLLSLAGCLTSDDAPDARELDADVRQAAELFLVADHDHHDADLHRFSHNLERIGYSNGVDQSGSADAIPRGLGFNELAVHGDYVYLSRWTPEPGIALPTPVCDRVPGTDGIPIQHGGFSIINIAVPSAPRVVSTYEAPAGSDIEVSADGDLVFFSTQRNCPNQMLGVLQADRDPLDLLPRGIHVVDVTDPTAPELAFYQPLPLNGPHTITYAQVNSQELVIVSTYDLYDGPSGDPAVVAATQRVLIYEVVRDDVQGNAALRLANTFFLTDRGGSNQLVFPHDAIPQRHPFTGQDLLYVSYWDKGLQVVDISDLNTALPVVGSFTDFSPSAINAIHQARAFDHLIDGRHVTVTEPEIISADETGQITFLDTSDPTQIRPISHWTLPGELTVSVFDFSPHNFVLDDGKVFLAHNHAGIWVLDVGSKANLESPVTAGYFLDVEPRLDAPIHQPWFWGTQLTDTGLVLAADQSSGLYILEYTGP